MSLASEYAAILAEISALERPREKNVGLPKDSAAVAKRLIELQVKAQEIRNKLEAQEAKANIDIRLARERSEIKRKELEAKTLNEVMAEEARQQAAIRRLTEIRRVASDPRILRMGPDSHAIKTLTDELTKSPELQDIGGLAVAQEILAKSQAVHQRVVGNVKRVAAKMFADRGYADKIPSDIEEHISAALKTGGNVYQYTDKKLAELQAAEIEQKRMDALSQERSARYAELRRSYSPKMAETILAREYPAGGQGGLKPGTAEHADMVRGLKRTGALKSFGLGAGSVLIAGLLARKIFGTKEEPSSLPPEMQMALAAQIQQAQAANDDRTTSRTLTDVGKLLSIVQALRTLGAGEAQRPVAPAAIM